jgi:hypothetical protein
MQHAIMITFTRMMVNTVDIKKVSNFKLSITNINLSIVLRDPG